MWAIITAFVRPGVKAASNCSIRPLRVNGSLSMKTGANPFWRMGATVVGKPAATVMTSSPGLSRREPSRGLDRAANASRLAEEPELHRTLPLTPRNSARLFSKASPSGPSVSQKSSVAPIAAATSSSVNTRPA